MLNNNNTNYCHSKDIHSMISFTWKKFRPFERTAYDIGEIKMCMESVPKLTTQVSSDVLKELCVMAKLEVWKDESVTRK